MIYINLTFFLKLWENVILQKKKPTKNKKTDDEFSKFRARCDIDLKNRLDKSVTISLLSSIFYKKK